ncbi:hypothetical protein GWI33_019438 [Rhynchophorus ferrugineus]|uniref:Uncharacterized protein n=1 Tax=Rhynchophorus ferrugineus TaxID=354439 RepID=A0A834HTQ7_RHYFE|nr:hypothetical protein GWI33_019438 [Rhynchophorus ferrugineus]
MGRIIFNNHLKESFDLQMSGYRRPSFTRRTDYVSRSNSFDPTVHSFGSSQEFSHISPGFSLWNSNHDDFNSDSFEFDKTFPDSSSSHFESDYSDPFLLTGQEAKNAASFLYRKELFFDEVPHVRSLLKNQESRQLNGLSPMKLGSLRLVSPWNRFKDDGAHPFNI